MNLDAFTLSAVADELLDVIIGGRVQDSVAVDETTIGLEIYASHQRHYLVLSADPQMPRIHLAPDKLRRGLPKPSQLGLLFRRMVEGGLIAHVSQPEWERLLILDVQGAEGDVQIIIEPMERRSNLLLVKEGIIQDCLRRVSAQENRVRVSLPNHPYQPPPAQMGKLNPFEVTQTDIGGLFMRNDDPKRKAQQVLTTGILGISPLVGREIVYRSAGSGDAKADDVSVDRVFVEFQTLISPLERREWRVGIAEGERGARAFSVYPLRSIPNWRPLNSISEALAWFYHMPQGADTYNAAKEPIRQALHEAQAKLSAKIASLQKSLTDDAERETLRQSGELILAYQYALIAGQTELRAVYDEATPELVIALDSSLTPLENAQRYFERYNKAKRALEDVPALLSDTKAELAFVAQLGTDLELAANWPEIDEVQQALQSAGYWKGKPVPRLGGGKSAPLRVTAPDGFVIWVGRNSRQNEQVTFEKASPADLWLHSRNIPGAHVIIKFDGRKIPDSVIEWAAALAAYYSAKQNEFRVDVDVTERRHVRKMKGGGQGMVIYRNETTLSVQPRNE
jgi:predicted ribosome quality control (RQC) complex YloA/Tae2 family protein